MKRLMFICTGNSARSQIAEGLAKHLLKNKYEIQSAGLKPKRVNPYAIKVMREIGIDISGQKSKAIDEKRLNQMDLVITLCDNAQESCPVTPPSIQTLHWSLPDPSAFSGSEDEILESFRKIRDEIKTRIERLLLNQ